MSQLLQSSLRSGAAFVELNPDHIDQGIPITVAGDIAVENAGAIDHYHQGLPFTAGNRLAVAISGAVDHFGNGAAPFTAAGLLCVVNIPHTYVSAGVPYTAAGQVALQT